MSDKTREEYEAKFRKPTSIEWNLEHKRYLGCGDERIKSLAQGYSYGYEVWQAAHEMCAPKCDAVEVAARTGFRAGWGYAGNNGIEMAETFAADYASLPVQEQDE